MIIFVTHFISYLRAMNKDHVQRVLEMCKAAQQIVITGHKSPDGDAVGSTLALHLYLKAKGIDSTVIVPDDYPKFLKWLPGNDLVQVYEHDIAKANELLGKAGLIFTLDYNHLSRVGNMTSALVNSMAPKVMIDHHQQPADYAEITFSDTSSCSTAQMIYQFIAAVGDEDLVTVEMAECIYCGLVTDSGSFRFNSVNTETHEIAAHLIAKGLDHAMVHRRIYDTNRLEKLKLVGYALSNKLEVLVDGRAAIIYLSEGELELHKYHAGDTEGLVNQALSIEGVNCAVFIREGKNNVKLSFRSKGNFDVNKFARHHFNGGGHMNAAGGAILETPLDEVVSNVKSVLETYKTDLDYEF